MVILAYTYSLFFIYSEIIVVGSIEEASELHEAYDYVIITTKTHSSDKLVQDIKPVISQKTCIVLIQNGLELEAPYINQYPNNSVISVITFVGVHQVESGSLEHFLPFKMNFGNGRHSEESYLPQDLSNIANFESIIVDSEIKYVVTDQMRMVSWHKVQFNGTLAVIAVLSGGLTLQELLTTPHTRELADHAISEVQGVARKLMGKGFPTWLPPVEVHHNQMINNPVPYKPSMLIDFEKGLPLEYESTLGNIVRMATKLDYPVPICRTNYALLKQIDVKNVSKTRV
jgi:2-dehydropantoate 2-reductase